jgi:hypothetical protein
MSTGSIERSLAHSREATRVRVGSELDRQIAYIDGDTIPLQPETTLDSPITYLFPKDVQETNLFPVFTHSQHPAR